MKNITLYTISTALVVLTFSQSAYALSEGAQKLKEQDQKQCAEHSAYAQGQKREIVSFLCQCSIEKTDYEKNYKNKQSGNINQLDADAKAVNKQCDLEYKAK
ncbi:MAG: hypothetical protein ACRBEE_12710 [Arenicella sp.]